MGRIGVRHLLGAAVGAYCLYIVLTVWALPREQRPLPATSSETVGWDFVQAPPPLPRELVATYLVIPGSVAAIPFLMANAIFGTDWLLYIGITFGAAFFWYGVGCVWDSVSAYGELRLPRIVSAYMMVLMVLSFPGLLLMALGTLGSSGGCAVGLPPAWVQIVYRGMLTQWFTLGVFFGLRHVWNRRPVLPQTLHL